MILLGTLPCLYVKIHLRYFGRRHQELQVSSTVLWVARTEVFTGCDLCCLASLLRAFISPTVGEAALKHIWKTYSNPATVFYSVNNLSVRESFCTLYALQGTVEIFFRFTFNWDFFQFINSLLLTDLSAWSLLGILYPTNSLSCDGHIIPVF